MTDNRDGAETDADRARRLRDDPGTRAGRIRDAGRRRSDPADDAHRTRATLSLSPDLLRELDRIGDDVALRYRWTFDADLDAETHLYALALALGLEELEGMDPAEIRDALAADDRLADPPDGGPGDG